MAQRYGGEFSPNGSRKGPAGRPPAAAPRRSRAGFRVNLLFVLPFLMLIPAFTSDAVGLALYLVAFGALELAAWLTREGLIAEDAYHARNIARRPAVPRKIFGSVLTAIGLGVAGLASDASAVLAPAIFAALGGTLHFMSFGPDPLKDKGVEGDAFQTERVARAVDAAEKRLEEMREAVKRAGVPALTRRVDAFGETARAMLRAIEDDPQDLTGARRYIGVYLEGARDATRQFADLYAKSGNEQARDDYEALLDDLEQTFEARTAKMLDDNKLSLDVEIEVLRERLAREGVSTKIGQ